MHIYGFKLHGFIFILVYPCGIPLVFFLVLRRKKNVIAELDRTKSCPAKLLKYEFLYSDYKSDCWHGEVYRSVMRVMFSALVIVPRAAIVRAFWSVLLSLCWLICGREYQAFLKVSNNALATMAQYQIFFTCLLALAAFHSALYMSTDCCARDTASSTSPSVARVWARSPRA